MKKVPTRFQASIRPPTKKEIESTHASLIGSFPEAIGLFFLIGCSLSLGASTMSLSRYVAAETTQKEMKAKKLGQNISTSKKFPRRIGAAKTLTFFNHCLGLTDLAI